MKKRKPVRWVIKRVRKRIPALLFMTAIDVAISLLGVAFALGTRGVINAATSGVRGALWDACLVQGAIIVAMLVCLTVFRHLRDRIVADLDRDWKRDLLDGLLHGDYAAVSSYHSGELLNRLNNDVRIIDDGLVGMLPNLAAMVTRLIAAMAVLVAMEPWFALVIVAAGIAVVAVTSIMRHLLKDLHKRVSETEGKVSGFIQETIENLLMVQAMDVADEMENRAEVLLEERYEAQRKRKNTSLLANTGISVLSYTASFFALVWCAGGLLNGSMSFGDLTAVTSLVGQLQGPFVNLSGIIPQYVGITAAAERLMEISEICGEKPPAGEEPQRIYADMRAIVARDLSFSYDRNAVFENASFTLPKGSFTVITGASGIGKSTLLKLMLGVFTPSGGGLYIEGDGGAIELDRSTRRLFAYVPQGNLLLSGTLRDNLTLTKPDATEEEIAQAVYVSGMDEYLSQLPGGLDTVLGEDGAGLSQGQAQRLAIARAVLGGAPILLLDEITSALDGDTEKTVLERIRDLGGRTCIAVTHRPAALELADYRIEVSEQGMRAESI